MDLLLQAALIDEHDGSGGGADDAYNVRQLAGCCTAPYTISPRVRAGGGGSTRTGHGVGSEWPAAYCGGTPRGMRLQIC